MRWRLGQRQSRAQSVKRAWSKHPRNHRQAPQASQTTTSQGRKSIKESNHQHQAPQASQSATKQKQSKTHTATSTTTTCPSSAAHVCAPSSSCHQPSWFGSDVNTLGDVAFCHKLSKAPPTVRTGHPAKAANDGWLRQHSTAQYTGDATLHTHSQF